MKKKSKKKKWLIIGGAIIVAAVLVALNLQQSNRGLVTVQTKKAVKTDVTSVVSGSGKVQPKTKISITSEASAEIISIPVKEGDFVTRGQLLIQLDTVQLKKDMESALYYANEVDARLEGARIVLEQRREKYDRQKGLFEKNLTSEQEFEDAEYSFLNQEANHNATVQQKKAAFSRLDKALDLLKKTTITAGMDGTITWLDAEVGEIAQAQTPYSQGKTLMILSDLSEYEIEVEIDETDIADLEIGQLAKIEIDAFPDTSYNGKVMEIGNTATTSGMGTNDQATNFRVKVALLEINPKVRPGMSSTVDITTFEHKDVVAIMIQALVMRSPGADSTEAEKGESEEEADEGGNVAVASTLDENQEEADEEDQDAEEPVEKKGVFVNRDGIARFVEVETGISDQQNIEIKSGLEKGDEVIIGSFRILREIKDGDELKVDNSLLKKGNGK